MSFLSAIPGWVKKACIDGACGLISGVAEDIGVNLYSPSEVENISQIKTLAAGLMSQSPFFSTDKAICEQIKNCNKPALTELLKNVSNESFAKGVAFVCASACQDRMRDVLMGACLNLVGCP